MNVIDLDPGDTGGSYKLVGGRLSLDFVNTVSWPGRPNEHDWMDSPQNWLRWTRLVGLVDTSTAKRLEAEFEDDRTRGLLRTLRATRDTIASTLVPIARDETPPPSAVQALSDLLARAAQNRTIDAETLRWIWLPSSRLEDLVWPVVHDAGELLTVEPNERRRIGLCPSCDWVFFDTSKNRSRRWCDMGECGSRHKARAYYYRTRERVEPASGS